MLSPDVAFLCDDPELGAHEFTVKRRKGRWERGDYVLDESETLTPIGNMQPASPEQLQTLPEGERSSETKVIYTRTLLHVTDGKKDNVSDEVYWNGTPYKVTHVNHWDEWGFCIAYAVKR